jgi:hypothetical protein
MLYKKDLQLLSISLHCFGHRPEKTLVLRNVAIDISELDGTNTGRMAAGILRERLATIVVLIIYLNIYQNSVLPKSARLHKTCHLVLDRRTRDSKFAKRHSTCFTTVSQPWTRGTERKTDSVLQVSSASITSF